MKIEVGTKKILPRSSASVVYPALWANPRRSPSFTA